MPQSSADPVGARRSALKPPNTPTGSRFLFPPCCGLSSGAASRGWFRGHGLSNSVAPTMKAAVRHEYGPPEIVNLEEIPTQTPADNEVLVWVHAASVNLGD